MEIPPEDRQQPFALVHGQPYHEIPQDLYIPPDALEVILETFEGPLDLLLYLIKHHNLDILDIPIVEVTKQYVSYIEKMQEMRFELAAEYLLMAALLAEIKSRMLLPRSSTEEEEEGDPRAELVRRLQEYERYKKAAEDIDQLPRQDRDMFNVNVQMPTVELEQPLPDVNLQELLRSFSAVLGRAALHAHHQIEREP